MEAHPMVERGIGGGGGSDKSAHTWMQVLESRMSITLGKSVKREEGGERKSVEEKGRDDIKPEKPVAFYGKAAERWKEREHVRYAPIMM